jgi:hypothetical protein
MLDQIQPPSPDPDPTSQSRIRIRHWCLKSLRLLRRYLELTSFHALVGWIGIRRGRFPDPENWFLVQICNAAPSDIFQLPGIWLFCPGLEWRYWLACSHCFRYLLPCMQSSESEFECGSEFTDLHACRVFFFILNLDDYEVWGQIRWSLIYFLKAFQIRIRIGK